MNEYEAEGPYALHSLNQFYIQTHEQIICL